MSTKTVSMPEGAVAIVWKNEWAGDNPAGPARWIGSEGVVIANLIDSDIEDTMRTIDFATGEDVPMPKYLPEWITLSEVNKIGKHFGVEVYES